MYYDFVVGVAKPKLEFFPGDVGYLQDLAYGCILSLQSENFSRSFAAGHKDLYLKSFWLIAKAVFGPQAANVDSDLCFSFHFLNVRCYNYNYQE